MQMVVPYLCQCIGRDSTAHLMGCPNFPSSPCFHYLLACRCPLQCNRYNFLISVRLYHLQHLACLVLLWPELRFIISSATLEAKTPRGLGCVYLKFCSLDNQKFHCSAFHLDSLSFALSSHQQKLEQSQWLPFLRPDTYFGNASFSLFYLSTTQALLRKGWCQW